MITRRHTRLTVAASAAVALSVLGATAASAHSAQPAKKKPKPPTYLTSVYQAAGTTLVKKPNSTVTLGPTQLTASINNQTDGITGTLPIPPTVANFKVLGLLPISATVSFIPVGGVVGQYHVGTLNTVTSTAQYTLQLSNVTLAGIPTSVGSSCQTSEPVTIEADTPAGQYFNVLYGGTLAGTYTIGDFANCGLTTSLINQLVPGPDNTVTLNLTDGQLQHP